MVHPYLPHEQLHPEIYRIEATETTPSQEKHYGRNGTPISRVMPHLPGVEY